MEIYPEKTMERLNSGEFRNISSIVIIVLKEKEMKSVGELLHVCSQIVLKCLYLARIGRPDILWINLHDRSHNAAKPVTSKKLDV